METPAAMVTVGKPKSLSSVRVAAVAWILTAVYYFYQYALRSAPAVMMPELSNAFGITPLAVASIVGLFYYEYSPFSHRYPFDFCLKETGPAARRLA
jgi:hypothetical protein